ncbi:hypothetical protein M3Y97_00140500 [Aphelenchoides bicaudatus]|nr:hypothetical protein M3Y97_00140500 [Aphelenchoides bicaudatus]
MQEYFRAKSKYAARLVERLLNKPTLDDFLQDRSDFEHFSSNLYDVYARFPRSTAVLDHVDSDGQHTFSKGPLTNVTWNLFFVATTLTSIGYGTNAPDSLVGRLFCILYISAGIPLYLITIADLAKFCTEFMNRSYTEFLKLKHQLKTRWKRWRRRDLRRRSRQSNKEILDDVNGSDSVDIGHVIIAGEEDDTIAEFLWTHLENTQFVEIPFLLIYIILLSYIGASSCLIAYLEEWPTQDGFYFVMMSVLTIGFGDVMPSKDKHVVTVLLLILVGLIITTTCVDIVGAYYIDQLHFFGRRLDIEICPFHDPLVWLKTVQQKRIDAMKREAMRKLFETIAALNRMQIDPKIMEVPLITSTDNVKIIELPDPPRNLLAYNATAQSVCLRWEAPIFVDEGKRYWYTISYKTRTPQRRQTVTVIDFVNTNSYEVKNLKSFTLYEFSVTTTTRFGSSVAVKAQEYTEPCTVPQSVRLEALNTDTATISWKSPRKNNGAESYVLMFAQEPAPQFRYWRRYRVGKTLRFTLTGLSPDTRYICCILAEHNFGLAAMSKSIRFCTRMWWFENEEDEQDMDGKSPSFQSGEPSPLFGQMFTAGSTEKIQTPTIIPPERRRSSAATNPNGRRRSSRRELTEDEKEHLLAIAGRTPTPTAMWRPKPLNAVDLNFFLRPTNINPEVLTSQAQFLASPMRHPNPMIAPPPLKVTIKSSNEEEAEPSTSKK